MTAGTLYLDSLTWDGAPDVQLVCPAGSAQMWQHAWVKAVDMFHVSRERGRISVIQNHGRGLLIQGTRDWRDYRVSAAITPHLLRAGGLAARVQGLQRYYALLLKAPGQVQLVKVFDGEESVLGTAALAWEIEQAVELSPAGGRQPAAGLGGRGPAVRGQR